MYMMFSMKDDVFAVIADPTRRQILQALAVDRLSVGELVEELGVSQPTASKHLRVLRTAGLVETEAVGQKRFYSITPAPLDTITSWVSELHESPRLASQLEQETQPVSPAPTDAPHPKTSGITFTPLTPFTPTLNQQPTVQNDITSFDSQEPEPVATSKDASLSGTPDAAGTSSESEDLSRQVLVLAQSVSLNQPDPATASFGEAVNPAGQEGAAYGEVTDHGAAEYIYETEVQKAGTTTPEDKGLLAKITRWGRRSNRS